MILEGGDGGGGAETKLPLSSSLLVFRDSTASVIVRAGHASWVDGVGGNGSWVINSLSIIARCCCAALSSDACRASATEETCRERPRRCMCNLYR